MRHSEHQNNMGNNLNRDDDLDCLGFEEEDMDLSREDTVPLMGHFNENYNMSDVVIEDIVTECNTVVPECSCERSGGYSICNTVVPECSCECSCDCSGDCSGDNSGNKEEIYSCSSSDESELSNNLNTNEETKREESDKEFEEKVSSLDSSRDESIENMNDNNDEPIQNNLRNDQDTSSSTDQNENTITSTNTISEPPPVLNVRPTRPRHSVFNVAIIIVPRPPRSQQNLNQITSSIPNQNVDINIENGGLNLNIENNTQTNEETTSNGENMNINDNNNEEINTEDESRARESLSRALIFVISLRGGNEDETNGQPSSHSSFEDIVNQLFLNYQPNNPPASEKAVKSCPIISFDESHTNEECCICKDLFRVQEFGLELPCKHLYHRDCITPWLKKNNTCPLCRHQLDPEDFETTETENQSTETTTETISFPQNIFNELNNENNIDDDLPSLEEDEH